uniref:Uncharacterized protein n=2 Tax=Oryza sativa subsp. japonica TaxID=39947 RepID=Q7XCP9_ORYSJ|nr:hypothetical protein LOC_Os10g37590 [Oryza sativa Japonica Group]
MAIIMSVRNGRRRAIGSEGITAPSKSNLQFIEHQRMRHRRECRCHMVVVKVMLAVAFIDIVVFVVGGLGGSSPPADRQAAAPAKAPPRGFIYIDSNSDDDGDGHSDGDGGRAANYTRGDGRNGRANSWITAPRNEER